MHRALKGGMDRGSFGSLSRSVKEFSAESALVYYSIIRKNPTDGALLLARFSNDQHFQRFSSASAKSQIKSSPERPPLSLIDSHSHTYTQK
ncbi:hypothetical protein TcasGA2_TC012022 [Tribolium castaneum]|uniref:Uncharacterized protein n=1 Tax=Tribolium castaneum TaxID=7070 RepID=D6X2D8_TRICA|nr:hypothetical protein TcasGA2_TC012022 [Tribolium castaneum]